MPDLERRIEQVDEHGQLLRRTTVFDMTSDRQQIVQFIRDIRDEVLFGSLSDDEREAALASLENQLAGLQGSIEEKIEGALSIHRELKIDHAAEEARVKEVNDVARKMRSSRDSVEHAMTRIKLLLGKVLDEMGETKYKGNAGTVYFSDRGAQVIVGWRQECGEDDKEAFLLTNPTLASAYVTISGLTAGQVEQLQKYADTRDNVSITEPTIALNRDAIAFEAVAEGKVVDGFSDTDVGQYVEVSVISGRTVCVR